MYDGRQNSLMRKSVRSKSLQNLTSIQNAMKKYNHSTKIYPSLNGALELLEIYLYHHYKHLLMSL